MWFQARSLELTLSVDHRCVSKVALEILNYVIDLKVVLIVLKLFVQLMFPVRIHNTCFNINFSISKHFICNTLSYYCCGEFVDPWYK